MRTEINITDFNGAAYLKTAYLQAVAIDAANGMTTKRDNRGSSGLTVIVRNTGTTAKAVTIPVTVSHLGATPAIITVPAAEAVILANIDGQWYASHGSVDFDFEAGFMGEIAAFRMPGER